MQNNDPQLNNTAAKKAGLNNRPGGLELIINKFSLFRKHNKFPLGDVRKKRSSVFFSRGTFFVRISSLLNGPTVIIKNRSLIF